MAKNEISQNLIASALLLIAFSAINPSVEALCSEKIATSLSLSGFSNFALALHAHNITTSSSHSRLTYLAPPDSSLHSHQIDADALRRHISHAGAFPYQALLTLPKGTKLPTLHHNATLLVGSDNEKLSFNDVLVTVPDLYFDGSCAVHGIVGPLIPIASSSLTDLRQPINVSPALDSPSRVHLRFIRRAHRPSRVDETAKTGPP